MHAPHFSSHRDQADVRLERPSQSQRHRWAGGCNHPLHTTLCSSISRVLPIYTNITIRCIGDGGSGAAGTRRNLVAPLEPLDVCCAQRVDATLKSQPPSNRRARQASQSHSFAPASTQNATTRQSMGPRGRDCARFDALAARRCDTAGHQLAGFHKSSSEKGRFRIRVLVHWRRARKCRIADPRFAASAA